MVQRSDLLEGTAGNMTQFETGWCFGTRAQRQFERVHNTEFRFRNVTPKQFCHLLEGSGLCGSSTDLQVCGETAGAAQAGRRRE